MTLVKTGIGRTVEKPAGVQGEPVPIGVAAMSSAASSNLCAH
jgi:hypothetical protein